MKSFFESKKNVTTIGTPDAKIIFTKASYIQYEQILLYKNFRQYIERIMVSKKILTMGIQKTAKTYEISIGSGSLTVEFYGSNRQFDWLELLLVYKKSNNILQYTTAIMLNPRQKKKKNVSLQNFAKAYGLTNEKRYNVTNNTKDIFCLNNLSLGAVTTIL